MNGLRADVNVQGHLPYLVQLLQALQLWDLLQALDLRFVTFPELGLDRRLDDRALWQDCQHERWILFTENRNTEGENSLQSTLADSWGAGNLPVLTLASKGRFEDRRDYAARVAEDVATILFGTAASGEFCDQPRIYVPIHWP